FKAIVGNLAAEIVARDVFHFMRFIENDGGIFGKDAAEVVLLEREVGEKEMVIHDDEVGVFGALVHRRDEALIELGALLAGAGVAASVEAHPEIGIVGEECQLGAVAGFGNF